MYNFVDEKILRKENGEIATLLTNGPLIAYITTVYGRRGTNPHIRYENHTNKHEIVILDAITGDKVNTFDFITGDDLILHDFDKEHIVFFDNDATSVKVLDIMTGQIFFEEQGKHHLFVENLYLSKNYMLGFYLNKNLKDIRIWDLKTGENRKLSGFSRRTQLAIKDYEFATHEPNSVKMWDLRSSNLNFEFQGTELNKKNFSEEDVFRHTVLHIDFNDKYIVTYSEDGIKLWDRKGTLLTFKSQIDKCVFDILNLDGDNLIVACLAGKDDIIKIINIPSGKTVQKIDADEDIYYSSYKNGTILVHSPDKRFQKKLKIWTRRRGDWLKNMLFVGKHWGEGDSPYAKNIDAVFKTFGKKGYQGGGVYGYEEDYDEDYMEGGDNMIKRMFSKKLSPEKQKKLQAVKNCKSFFSSPEGIAKFNKVYEHSGEDGVYQFCKYHNLI